MSNRSKKIWPNSTAAALSAALLICGCAKTIIPKPVVEQQASWDGNEQNSGFLGFTADGHGILTGHARDRYNALIDLYGKDFHPPLEHDAGIGTAPPASGIPAFSIDGQHLEYFLQMQRRYRSGRPGP